MEILSTIGQYFMSAFAWVVDVVSTVWQQLMSSALITGVERVLGSGLTKLLVAATLALLAATVLKAIGVLDEGTLKMFIALFIFAIALSVMSALISGNYWFAFGVLVFAVLVLATAATIDPSVVALAAEVLTDAVEITGELIGSIAGAVASASSNFLTPALVVLGFFVGYKVLNKKGTK